MKESAIERHLTQRVRELGGLSFKLAPTTKGLPDRLIIHNGQLHLVELKAPDGRLSPAQQVLHGRIAERGVGVTVLWSVGAVDAWCDSLG